MVVSIGLTRPVAKPTCDLIMASIHTRAAHRNPKSPDTGRDQEATKLESRYDTECDVCAQVLKLLILLGSPAE